MSTPTNFPTGIISTQEMPAFDESSLMASDNIFSGWGVEQASRPYEINREIMTHTEAVELDEVRMIINGPKRPDVRVGDKLVLNATTFRMFQAEFSKRHGAQESVLTISGIPENEKPCIHVMQVEHTGSRTSVRVSIAHPQDT